MDKKKYIITSYKCVTANKISSCIWFTCGARY